MKQTPALWAAAALAAVTAAALAVSSGCSTTRFSPTPTPVSCKARIAINPCAPGTFVRVRLDGASVYDGAPSAQVVELMDIASGKQHAVEWRVYLSGCATPCAVPIIDSGTSVFSDGTKNPCLDVLVPCQ